MNAKKTVTWQPKYVVRQTAIYHDQPQSGYKEAFHKAAKNQGWLIGIVQRMQQT